MLVNSLPVRIGTPGAEGLGGESDKEIRDER